LNWARFGKNLLFALVLFLIASSIDQADLPLANRLEEYVAFVLTTDFDYRRWIEEAKALDLIPWEFEMPWARRAAGGAPFAPAAAGGGR